MDFKTYTEYFESIVDSKPEDLKAPYDNPDYFNYTKLNFSRSKRWLKTGALTVEAIEAVSSVSEPQQWIIITEPWCGDAAHVVPFIQMLAELNPLITTDYELRDSPPHRINDYLTRGGKSIPKLIIRNAAGKDLATWGPRPAGCQLLYDQLMLENSDFETVKTELQNWYNKDKGQQIMEELSEIISNEKQVKIMDGE